MTLVEHLKKAQATRTQTEMAALLGITQGHLSRIYSGHKRIGLQLARLIGATFPELQPQVTQFLWHDAQPQGFPGRGSRPRGINTNITKGGATSHGGARE